MNGQCHATSPAQCFYEDGKGWRRLGRVVLTRRTFQMQGAVRTASVTRLCAPGESSSTSHGLLPGACCTTGRPCSASSRSQGGPTWASGQSFPWGRAGTSEAQDPHQHPMPPRPGAHSRAGRKDGKSGGLGSGDTLVLCTGLSVRVTAPRLHLFSQVAQEPTPPPLGQCAPGTGPPSTSFFASTEDMCKWMER